VIKIITGEAFSSFYLAERIGSKNVQSGKVKLGYLQHGLYTTWLFEKVLNSLYLFNNRAKAKLKFFKHPY